MGVTVVATILAMGTFVAVASYIGIHVALIDTYG